MGMILVQTRYKQPDEQTKLKAFCELEKVLNSYGQKFFLIGSAFLGQHREGGFIPWDTDIDIGIFYEDYDDSIENFFSESKSWNLIEAQGEKEFGRRLIVACKKYDVPIDILIHYPLMGHKDYFYFCAFHIGYKGKVWPTYKNHIRGLRKEPFYHTRCWVPSNDSEYLEECYGKHWEIPDNWNKKTEDPPCPNLSMEDPRDIRGDLRFNP